MRRGRRQIEAAAQKYLLDPGDGDLWAALADECGGGDWRRGEAGAV